MNQFINYEPENWYVSTVPLVTVELVLPLAVVKLKLNSGLLKVRSDGYHPLPY